MVIEDLKNKDQSQFTKEQRSHELARLSMQNEVLSIKSACDMKLQYGLQREDELVKELKKRDEVI